MTLMAKFDPADNPYERIVAYERAVLVKAQINGRTQAAASNDVLSSQENTPVNTPVSTPGDAIQSFLPGGPPNSPIRPATPQAGTDDSPEFDLVHAMHRSFMAAMGPRAHRLPMPRDLSYPWSAESASSAPASPLSTGYWTGDELFYPPSRARIAKSVSKKPSFIQLDTTSAHLLRQNAGVGYHPGEQFLSQEVKSHETRVKQWIKNLDTMFHAELAKVDAAGVPVILRSLQDEVEFGKMRRRVDEWHREVHNFSPGEHWPPLDQARRKRHIQRDYFNCRYY